MRLAALTVLIACQLTVAQTWRGSVAGTVSDPSDARIGNAGITVTADETGTRRTTRTDPRGEWNVSGLAPGTYRIEAERDGFAAAAETVTLSVQAQVRVDLRLRPGTRTDQVSVSATPPTVVTDAPALSTFIENRNI
ncbi:MAG TPA: carboxypeptidase-like regulatory domain-containing protein, partial [Bryobacteraceae bacterium]|nr:carboxypeptidase-like regulatory domain-containing protein [Bryobacteraceae bacterium]